MKKLYLALFMAAFTLARSARGSTGPESSTAQCGRIEFTGDTVTHVVVNGPFAPSSVSDAIARFVRGLQQVGYYYAQVTVSSLKPRGDTIDVVATVRRGPVLTVGDIKCDGLVRNSARTVRRYLRIPPRAVVNPELLSTAESRARQIPYLSFEPPIAVEPRAGYNAADLVVRFREPSAVALSGAGGYRADDQNGLVWMFDGSLRDVLGDGRRVRVISERRDRRHTTLTVAYQQPLVLLGMSEVGASILSRDFRDQFSQLTVRTGLTIAVGDRTRAGANVEWSRVDQAGKGGGYTRNSAGVSYCFSSATDTVNPVSGLSVRWSTGYQYRRLRPGDDSTILISRSANETRSQVVVERHQMLGSRSLVAASSLNLMLLSSSLGDFPISELFLLGGPGTIRGYRTDQFAANRAAIGNCELRLRSQSGYLYLFGDLAYINQPQDGGAREMTKVGYGCGFKLRDRDKAVTVTLGWNPDLKIGRPQVILQLMSGL